MPKKVSGSSKKSKVSRKIKTGGMFEAPPKEFITEKIPFEKKSIQELLSEKMQKDISNLEKDNEKSKKNKATLPPKIETIDNLNKQELKDFLKQEDIDLSYEAKYKYHKPLSSFSNKELKESIKDNLNSRVETFQSTIKETEKMILDLKNPENLKILENIFQIEKDIYDDFIKQIKPQLKEDAPPYDDLYLSFIDQYMTFSPFLYKREEKKDSWIVDWNDKQSQELLNNLKPYEGKVVFLSGGSGAMGIHGDYRPVLLEKVERVPILEEQRMDKDMNE